MSKEFLRPKEASHYLGIPEGTLANWRFLRKGPPYSKRGYVILYRVSELEEWANAGRVETVQHAAG